MGLRLRNLFQTLPTPTPTLAILTVHTVFALALQAYLHLEPLIRIGLYLTLTTHFHTDLRIDIVFDTDDGFAFAAFVHGGFVGWVVVAQLDDVLAHWADDLYYVLHFLL